MLDVAAVLVVEGGAGDGEGVAAEVFDVSGGTDVGADEHPVAGALVAFHGAADEDGLEGVLDVGRSDFAGFREDNGVVEGGLDDALGKRRADAGYAREKRVGGGVQFHAGVP